MFLSRNMKNIYEVFFVFLLSENFQFLEVKFSIYLNRRVFVMICFEYVCCYKALLDVRCFLTCAGILI